MAEPQFESRLDRIEAAIEKLTEEQRALTRSHIVLSASLDRTVTVVGDLAGTVREIGIKLTEVEDKLNGLVGIIERDHREFHERLKRLESHS